MRDDALAGPVDARGAQQTLRAPVFLLEVLELLAAGKAKRQIAEVLVIAPDTVKKHVSHLLDKLGPERDRGRAP